MKNDIDVVFFDLFFTLVIPKYNDLRNENDVLGITKDEWERYSEDDELYLKRATSNSISPEKIIEDILNKMKIDINDHTKKEILILKEDRFKNSLINVDPTILDVLSDIKNSGKKLCLISNADIIDVMYWNKSPLRDLFDDTIFSYEVGYLKPQTEIYKIALEKMKVNPENSVFIGDGGSDELKGAKELGMRTILTDYLLKREIKQHNEIKKFADYHIEDFKDLIDIINH
ncbi:HAD-IA family hydrolase [Clostridium chromiireducens]|uniref:HAD-IA family hydrolase n=1 Tax=Clostridium chromiireducens TaxID=225345 RepID=A0A964RSV7_9CLOT|nr:HAD family hydrolase [Clostridium chromiireducens]MVX66988.1 HAD-IA family hydrolase [Clostridium chromiireducens]